MLFVITAYAINAVHGELFCFSDNGNADNGWRRKKVLHGVEREEKWVELSNPPSLMPCGMATSMDASKGALLNGGSILACYADT
jgi:hypothetical protein